jgi:WD40 repeat protein
MLGTPAVSPNQRILVGPAMDGTLRLVDLDSGERRALRIEGAKLTRPVFSADGRWLAALAGARAALWDMSSGRRRDLAPVRARLTALAVAPRGSCLVTGDEDGEVLVWPAAGGAARRLVAGRGASAAAAAGGAAAAPGESEASHGVASVAVAGECDAVAWATDRGGLSLWRRLAGAGAAVVTLATDGDGPVISPDGRLVAATTERHTLELWDLASATQVTAVEAPEAVRAFALAPDGRSLAAVVDDAVRVWSIEVPDRPAALVAWLRAARPGPAVAAPTGAAP